MSFTILLPISNSHDSHIHSIQRQQSISDYTTVHELGKFVTLWLFFFFTFQDPPVVARMFSVTAVLALQLSFPIALSSMPGCGFPAGAAFSHYEIVPGQQTGAIKSPPWHSSAFCFWGQVSQRLWVCKPGLLLESSTWQPLSS